MNFIFNCWLKLNENTRKENKERNKQEVRKRYGEEK